MEHLGVDPDEIFALKPSAGDSPFYVVFDEVAYYATSGMDRMLAMGRGLNVGFWLAFQEVSGIWARLGEKTQSLLGNANLTIAMRQQDANRTREWLQKTAGETAVTQATSYQGGSVGQYREAQHAEVRQVSRIDWQDLQNLLEGEAIVMSGGRRIAFEPRAQHLRHHAAQAGDDDLAQRGEGVVRVLQRRQVDDQDAAVGPSIKGAP